MSFEAGDLVDVPFPFIDSGMTKLRPALVLSTSEFQRTTGACLLAMVTSAERSRWGNDVALIDWALAGLKKPSIVRWKVFTLDETLIEGRRGRLADQDLAILSHAVAVIFSGWSLK